MSGGSIEHLLLSKIIGSGSLQEITNAGVKPIHFAATWEANYQWVLEYHQKHSTVPSERAWASQFGHLEILDTDDEPFSGLIEELLQAYKQREVVSSISDAMACLDKDEVDSAMKLLSSGLQRASVDAVRLRDVDLVENWEERYAAYEEMRSNPNALRGIPSGFMGLDKLTHGFRPQQFIVVAGEVKRKKSWIAMFSAINCHIYGKTPMIVSYEMSNLEQASRYDAAMAKLDYDRVLRGALNDIEMERLHRSMVLRKNMHPFLLSEDTTSMTTVSALAGKLQEHQPDFLVVDGLYLMDDDQGENKGTSQALTNISRGIKRLAQRFDIPILGTTQALPWKVTNQKRNLTTSAIGYSSALGQDADLLLGIEDDPDIDNQSILRIMDGRTVGRAQFNIRWDFKTTSFSEGNDEYEAKGGWYD